MTHRRVRVLVDGLPPESLVKTAIRDTLTSDDFAQSPEPEGWGVWSKTDELLAVLADRMDWLIFTLAAVNSEKGKGPKEPTPMRRPGVGMSGSEKRALRRTQMISAAHLAYVLEHGGAAPPPDWDHGVPDDD